MVVRDSVSKCDYSNPYGDKFALHKGSAASHVSTSFTKDVLEISEDKLKKEAMAHLDSAANRVPSGLYVVICRVGKYTFLALTLPPYFLFYMIPKWMLTTAIPEVLKGVWNPVARLIKMVQRSIKITVHAVWHPVIHFFKRIGNKVKQFQRQIHQVLSAFTNRVSSGVKQMIGLLFNPVQTALNQLAAALVRMKAFNPLAQIKQWRDALAQGMSSFFQGINERLGQLKKKVTRKMANGSKWIVSRGGPILQRLTQTFQSSSAIANKLLAWGGEQVKIPFQAIAKRFITIKTSIQPILQGLRSTLNGITHWIQQLAVRFKNRFNALLRPFKQGTEAFGKYTREFFRKGNAFATAIAKKAHDALPLAIQRFLNENRFILFLKELLKSIFRVISTVFTAPFRLIGGIFSKVKQTGTLVSKAYQAVVSGVSSALKAVYKPIDQTIHFALRSSLYILKKTIYWNLIVLILTAFTIQFAFTLLVLTGSRLSRKLPQAN